MDKYIKDIVVALVVGDKSVSSDFALQEALKIAYKEQDKCVVRGESTADADWLIGLLTEALTYDNKTT